MDHITTDAPATPTREAPAVSGAHDHCLTLDLTRFLLGRVSMDEVCQYCVLEALSPMHPWQMSIYTVGSDSLFRLVGKFGKGPGHDVLHEYSCLDDPHVGEGLRDGRPLATFPLIGMGPEHHLNLPELKDGPQALWPLTAQHRLIGVIHIRFPAPPEAQEVSDGLAAIAGPIALALELQGVRDQALLTPSLDLDTTPATSTGSPLMHPSLMGPLPVAGAPRPLSVVTSPPPEPSRVAEFPRPEDLTPRQLRVLSLMAKGMTNGQIARVLAFSESTVRQETMAIYRILQVKGRAEAVELGRSRGLIPTTPSA